MVRNLRFGSDWIPGVIVERLGPVTYLVDVGRDQIWKRHSDQLRSIAEKPPSQNASASEEEPPAPPTVTAREESPELDDEVVVPVPTAPTTNGVPAPHVPDTEPGPEPDPGPATTPHGDGDVTGDVPGDVSGDTHVSPPATPFPECSTSE